MNTVFISGASSGLGLAFAIKMKQEGFSVIGFGRRNKSDIRNFENIFSDYLQVDIYDYDFEKKLVDFLDKHKNEISALINNLGKSEWKSIKNIDNDFLQQMFEINLRSNFLTSKIVIEKNNKLKSIVNISSIAGRRGSKNNSVYSSFKFGSIGFTQSLAKELGPQGIRVNAVSPVLILTDGLKNALSEKESPVVSTVEEFLDDFTIQQSALGRLPRLEEVAEVVFFLISEKASAITAQNINVDCGVFPQ